MELTKARKKLIIEVVLSVLGLTTAAALIFIPTMRSSSADASRNESVSGGSWTDMDGGAENVGDLPPADPSDEPGTVRRQAGDP